MSFDTTHWERPSSGSFCFGLLCGWRQCGWATSTPTSLLSTKHVQCDVRVSTRNTDKKKYRRQVFKKERTRKNRKLDVKRIPTKLVASAISFAIIWFSSVQFFFFFFNTNFWSSWEHSHYTESRWRIPDWRQVLSIRTRFARLGGRLTTWSVLDFQSRQTLFFEEFCLVSMKRYWNGENHACAEETAIHHNWSATAAS